MAELYYAYSKKRKGTQKQSQIYFPEQLRGISVRGTWKAFIGNLGLCWIILSRVVEGSRGQSWTRAVKNEKQCYSNNNANNNAINYVLYYRINTYK